MRVWVGNRIDNETTAVFAFDQPARPSLDEIGKLLSELLLLNDDPASDLARRADFVARRKGLTERIDGSEQPVPEVVPLHPVAGRPFNWGDDGPGARELARAVLTDALRRPPLDHVVDRYVAEIVAFLPRDQFRLDAADLNEWLMTQDFFVEAELTAQRGGLDPNPRVMRVVAPGEAPSGDTLGEAGSNPATASALVAACEQAWADIQRRHPDVPHAVVVLGSGVERGRLVKLGHWWGGRWLADGQVRGEVLLAGEALNLPAEAVFEVLLHEAAHGINAALDVKDTSRGGRYHNKKFRVMAELVGLDVSVMAPYGFARTTLTPETVERYRDTIDRLGDAMRIARTVERATGIGLGDEKAQPGNVGDASLCG